jgi:hypothetical protein
MRSKVRGTLQIQEDVKRLFMLAKPLNVTSSDFLKELLRIHAQEVRKAQERSQRFSGLAALNALGKTEDEQIVARPTCLGRPPGAKDLQPRRRRTKAALAREARLQNNKKSN